MFKSKKNKFVDLCAKGKLLLDDIDDYVDSWHESSSNLELYEYLGMTQQEYRLWVREPEFLSSIIKTRVKSCSIDTVISGFNFQDLPMADRADSPENAKRLMEWLKKAGI